MEAWDIYFNISQNMQGLIQFKQAIVIVTELALIPFQTIQLGK